MHATLFAGALLGLASGLQLTPAGAKSTIPFIPANQGWTTVPFAGTGESTLYGTNFGDCTGSISLGIPTCTGFQLQVAYQNGTAIGETPVLPPVPPCTTNFSNPLTPPGPADWIVYSFPILEPGAVVLNITTLNGDAGTYLGLKFDADPTCVNTTCTGGSSQFVYIPTAIAFGEADEACEIRGYTLAGLTNANFLDATSTVFACAGAFSSAWIHDWYGNTYEGAALSVNTGAAPTGGAITVPTPATTLGTLCVRAAMGQYVYYL